jgi:hypothetical protein
MNKRFQMQGGKNWFLPKEMNANRFFWDSHWLEIWSNHFYPSMGPNGGSVAMDSGQTTYVPLWNRMEVAWLWTLSPYSHAPTLHVTFKQCVNIKWEKLRLSHSLLLLHTYCTKGSLQQ